MRSFKLTRAVSRTWRLLSIDLQLRSVACLTVHWHSMRLLTPSAGIANLSRQTASTLNASTVRNRLVSDSSSRNVTWHDFHVERTFARTGLVFERTMTHNSVSRKSSQTFLHLVDIFLTSMATLWWCRAQKQNVSTIKYYDTVTGHPLSFWSTRC